MWWVYGFRKAMSLWSLIKSNFLIFEVREQSLA